MWEALLNSNPMQCKGTKQVWLMCTDIVLQIVFVLLLFLFSLIVIVSHGNYNTVTLLEVINYSLVC